jgi:hypothetical protein
MVQSTEIIPDDTAQRMQQLMADGAVKATHGPNVVELSGYDSDTAYTMLYPTDGDVPVRVPKDEVNYYLARPAQKKGVRPVMVRSGNGVLWAYSDGSEFKPAFQVVPLEKSSSSPASSNGAVAQTVTTKQTRKKRHRGSRGSRR